MYVAISRPSTFIVGRYLKFSREMSQTIWTVGDTRKTPVSVEEEIAYPLMRLFGAEAHKFISAGREDYDVRMLGNGRPFCVELINPIKWRHNIDPTSIDGVPITPPGVANMIDTGSNGKVKVVNIDIICQNTSMSRVKKEIIDRMKQGAEEKKKTYRCVIRLSPEDGVVQLDPLNRSDPLTIYQKTPIRVLHRRTSSTRRKTIFSMKYEPIGKHPTSLFALTLSTDAGTYIKEFVHGDLGRTKPSVRSILGCDVDILQLDVMDLVIADS